MKSFIESDSTNHAVYSQDPSKLELNVQARDEFLKYVNSIESQTSREEIIKRFRLKLINKIAHSLNITKCLFAYSQTKLTVELLSNIAIGKGAHVSSEAVFFKITCLESVCEFY